MKSPFIYFCLGCLLVLPSAANAEIVSYIVSGLMDGGGPGFRYDAGTSDNAKDYDPTFSFKLTYNTSQTVDGTYDFTFGQFTINTSSDASSDADYVGTLNSSFTQNLTVSASADTFVLEMIPTNLTGTVAAAQFTGDEVWSKDGGSDKSTSNTGADGPDDRYFLFSLVGNTSSTLTSDALPNNLDELDWDFGDKDTKIRIRWRDANKISLVGSITGIEAVPEPTTILLFGSVLGLVLTPRRRRRIAS